MFSCTFIRPTPRIRRTPRLPRQDGAAGPFMRRGVRSARALLAMLLAPAREPTAGSAIRGNMTSHVAPRAISSCLALRGDGNAALAGSFNARAAWASPFHRRAVSRAPSLRRARSVALAAGESAVHGLKYDTALVVRSANLVWRAKISLYQGGDAARPYVLAFKNLMFDHIHGSAPPEARGIEGKLGGGGGFLPRV